METQFYQHVVRLGTDEVEGILNGTVYVYTKLDGTNTGVHYENGQVIVNSRKRELTEEKDNAGSREYVLSQEKYKKFFEDYPNLYLYGEFLVKHTVRTYKDSAWRKLYIFDVVDYDNNRYLSYEEYAPILDKYNIEYIPLIAKLENPTKEEVVDCLNKTTYLQKDDNLGEGIVIKRYDGWRNKYNRITWAKVVRTEFLASKKTHNTVSEISKEQEIADTFCTDAFIEKELTKVLNDIGKENWNNKYIGRCLNTVWHTLIEEESWNIIKKYKNPTINFSVLYTVVQLKTKDVMHELFKKCDIELPF